jgi:hypothetical protein
MEINISSNVKEFTRYLDHIQKQQVPYATSRAMNDAAVDAQNAIVERIQTAFRSIKKWWLKQQPTGVKVKFSKKQDLHARVYTNAYFAEIQEKGGTKTPKSSSNLAVPTAEVPRKYRNSRGAHDMINERNNVFRTQKGVFKRTGKKGKITVLWTFTRSARIKPAFGFMTTAESTFKKRFPVHFEQRIKQALASAKAPSRP